MADRNEKTIAQCWGRVGRYCLQRIKDAMLGMSPELQPVVVVERPAEPPCLAIMLDRIPRTGPGAKALRCAATVGLPCAYAPPTPKYNEDLYKLTIRGKFVHRFAHQACNEIQILIAFQQKGWPRWIDDPLGNRTQRGFHKRLENAVQELNVLARPHSFHFFTDRPNRRVGWEIIDEST